MTTPFDTKQEELQTVSPSGGPAPRRIATAEAAFSIFESFKESDSEDAVRRATIQGMIDGNPPYDQKELDEMGLGNCLNVNFMSFRANLDARAAAAHELFMEVPTLIECSPRKTDLALRGQNHLMGVIAEEFTSTVRGWHGFLPHMDLVFRESDAYGIGFALFPDEYTWQPKAYKRGNLLLDPMANINVESNDVYMVRDAMTAGDLYDKIRDPELASEEGWNVTGVELVLKKIFLEGSESGDATDKFQRSIVETLQQMARNCDPQFQDKQFERIRVVHVLSREVTSGRKITHQIIPENASHKLFLFEAHDRFDTMSQVIWWLPFNYGDGYARSVRGVGSWMAQHDDLSNRFLCRVFDAGFMISSLLLQPKSAIDLGKTQFIQHGPYTIVPPDLVIQQTSFQPQISPLIQLRNVSEDIMKNNTGMYRQHPETFNEGGQVKTARQVVEETAKEARFEKAAVAHRYNHYEVLYREIFRRLVVGSKVTEGILFEGRKEAEEFMTRCKDRGVPESLLRDWDKHFTISAAQAIGLGSLGVRFDITNQLMAERGSMDAEGQVQAFRDWLAARVSYRNVDKYRPPVSRDQIPSNEHSIATLENNDIMAGQPVAAGSDQLQPIHIMIHAPMVAQIIQAVDAGQVQDPMQAATALQTGLQHLDAHYQIMIMDKGQQQLAKQVEDLLKEGQTALDTLQRDIERMQKQQQQKAEQDQKMVDEAGEVVKDREIETKMYEIQRKFDLERMKQESLNSMRAEKTAEQMRINREKTAENLKLQGERQAAELDIAARVADAKIAAAGK